MGRKKPVAQDNSPVAGKTRPRISLVEYAEKMAARGFDEHGNFYPDPEPMAPPIGFKEQPSMVEIIRSMIKSEALAFGAEMDGNETFEEADDFDCGDEDGELLQSGYENDFEPPDVQKMRERVEAAKAAKAAEAEAPSETPARPVAPEKA